MAKERYDHRAIEPAAQEKWASLNLHETDLSDSSKEPYYLLFEFPYPSGDLHIGHWYAYALTDIYARMLKAQGKNVLFPIGFDAFGLPAENAAIKGGADPKEWTYANMDRMREQIKRMGTTLDWSKEIITCEPSYYKWTQWLFTKLLEQGLAERRNAAVKWCPKDQTVLANEQVLDGKCERCGTEVEEKHLTQWFLKITQYAKRLLDDLAPLPWREEIKEAQRAWIGESEGAKLTFMLHGEGLVAPVGLDVFTTRADTLFGATYLVLAPEHPLIDILEPALLNEPAVREYQAKTSRKTERERSENKEKTGIALEGITAVNPANNESIPVYLADYVLASYGTGAVMAVPAHDERDFEFAKKYHLPIRQVIAPETGEKHPDATRRDGGCALIFDPTSQKYAVLTRPNTYLGLCAGGVDEDEDITEGILREVREESGLHDFKEVEFLGGSYPNFHNVVKDKRITAYAACLLVVLNSTDTIERKLEAHEKFEVVWVTADELRKEWEEKGGRNVEHWLWFLKQGVGRAIELGYDTQSDPKQYRHEAYTDDGLLVNSGEFNERGNREAMDDIIKCAGGERVTNYRIRDWLVSRQRYWGCPIPVVYDPEGAPHAIPKEHLPWLLPTDVDFAPTGKSPLASSNELRERVEHIFGEGWTPEYDTLDVFVDSSWYFTRYLDPSDDHDFSDASLMKKWLPVNRYSGGSEHTTVHLLYARFFYKVLYDLALVPTSEPFIERFNRGLIMGTDGAKMSKSRGNVVNPDEFVEKYGSDSVRMYLAFIGPYNETGHYPWNLDGVESMRKFLDRIHALKTKVRVEEPTDAMRRALARASSKIAGDGDRFKLNTAVSALMVLVRDLESLPSLPEQMWKEFLTLVAPFAPHLAEHLYETTAINREVESIHQRPWPAKAEEEEAVEAVVVVQVNGKRKGEVSIASGATEEEVLDAAKGIPSIQKALHEGAPDRVIYVPGRILNLVFRG